MKDTPENWIREYRLAATMKENLMFVKKNILCYVEQEI